MSLAHSLQANHLRCLLSSRPLQIKYACAMIETGTRHTILICACTNPEEVAGILRTFHLSLLISNVKHVLLHLARAPIVQVNAYRTRAITQSVSRNPRSDLGFLWLRFSNLNHNMLAPQVPLLCPERRGASRYLSSSYILGPCESAKEEEKEV
jgi:hypothetical protein